MNILSFTGSIVIPCMALVHSASFSIFGRTPQIRFLPNMRALFFISGALGVAVISTGIRQKHLNERLIQKYLTGYTNEQLSNFDQVLMNQAITEVNQ